MNVPKKEYITVFIAIIFIILTIIIASSLPFRFSPSHRIVKEVMCFSCHSEEFDDLKEGNHIKMMKAEQNRTLYDYLEFYGDVSEPTISLEGACYSCHITTANFNRFGLTDPYEYFTKNITYTMGNLTSTVESFDAQYGNIINWSENNENTTYFNPGNNTSISVELSVFEVSPANFSVESTVIAILANYSGQQTGNTSFDAIGSLAENGTMILNINNITEDYFKIIVLLDGGWNNTILNLRINGTDKGTESFFIIADNHPFVYELPFNENGVYYFRTNGTYKAERLDYILEKWSDYLINNITTSQVVKTNMTYGLISSNTCSAPSAMCHISQKTTYMGLSNGMNPSKSLYAHQMEYITSRQCKLCHLKNKLVISS